MAAEWGAIKSLERGTLSCRVCQVISLQTAYVFFNVNDRNSLLLLRTANTSIRNLIQDSRVLTACIQARLNTLYLTVVGGKSKHYLLVLEFSQLRFTSNRQYSRGCGIGAGIFFDEQNSQYRCAS